MANILLTGGAGFIGKNLYQALKKDHQVSILDIRKNDGFFADYTEGDYGDTTLTDHILDSRKIDVVVLLASCLLPGSDVSNLSTAVHNDLISAINLMDRLRVNKVNKIVFFSSGGTVYGANGKNINNENDPTNPIDFYGWMKLSMENFIRVYCNQQQMQYLILRPGNAYGNFQDIYGKQGLIAVTIGKIINNNVLEIWGDGSNVRDYIEVGDIAYAVRELLHKDQWNHILNVGSGKGFSTNEILRKIENITGRSIQVEYKETRKSDVPVNVLDNSKLRSMIDFEDLCEIDDGIRLFWNNCMKG